MLEKGDIKRSRVFFWEEEGEGKREERFLYSKRTDFQMG
jgi:hypothetical protein